MSYDWFNREEVLQKAEEKYHNCGGKEKAAEYYIANKDVFRKRQEINTETCQKKKKKQKGNIAERDTRKLKKSWEVNYKNKLLLV